MLNKEKPVEVIIDKDKCTKCGQCVKACSRCSYAGYLTMQDNEIVPNENAPIGCIQCGHCMMSCPKDAIYIRGFDISEKDIINIPENYSDYDSLHSLFLKRRSIRQFKKQEIPKEIIDKILDAASAAPIGVPPSEVKVLVVNGYAKVEEFTEDLKKAVDKTVQKYNPLFVNLVRPFVGEGMYRMIKDFAVPGLKAALDGSKDGKDIIMYHTPAFIMFYGSNLTDKEEVVLAAGYAILAAESLGLATCPCGIIPCIFERSKELQEKYGTQKTDLYCLSVLLGYPDMHFKKAIKRRFKDVKYIN